LTRARERRGGQAGKENIGTNVYVDGREAGSFLLPVDQQIYGANSTS
jgi:hypothetical protein